MSIRQGASLRSVTQVTNPILPASIDATHTQCEIVPPELMTSPIDDKHRCPWARNDPLYHRYHDEEWGVPVHDDRLLFEFLILEGAQAGLSWSTILRKRQAYRHAFADFDPETVASFDPGDIDRLL